MKIISLEDLKEIFDLFKFHQQEASELEIKMAHAVRAKMQEMVAESETKEDIDAIRKWLNQMPLCNVASMLEGELIREYRRFSQPERKSHVSSLMPPPKIKIEGY